MLILSLALKRWQPPDGRDYVATRPLCGLKRGGPQDGRGYIATRPLCGLKRWGPPRWHGLCSHEAHFCWICPPL